MNYKVNIYIFIGLFLVVFLLDYFLINRRKLAIINNKGKAKKGKKKKNKNIGELDYLVTKFKLNTKLLNKEQIILWISLINSFIISFVSSIIMIIPLQIIWQMLIAFVLLFGLIYSLYEIYGRHLKKQEENKKGDKNE